MTVVRSHCPACLIVSSCLPCLTVSDIDPKREQSCQIASFCACSQLFAAPHPPLTTQLLVRILSIQQCLREFASQPLQHPPPIVSVGASARRFETAFALFGWLQAAQQHMYCTCSCGSAARAVPRANGSLNAEQRRSARAQQQTQRNGGSPHPQQIQPRQRQLLQAGATCQATNNSGVSVLEEGADSAFVHFPAYACAGCGGTDVASSSQYVLQDQSALDRL